MKKTLLIALAFFALTTQVEAQKQRKENRKENAQRMDRFKDFTPEEIAQLRTKKMTLDLDLSEKQQSEVNQLFLTEAKDRKQMIEGREETEKSLSKEERFNRQNERLDKLIAYKNEMKRILDKNQFEKWEKMLKARKQMVNTKKQKKNKADESRRMD